MLGLRRPERLLLVLLAACALVPAARVRAWTEAGVSSVLATVSARADGHVHVRMDLTVAVRGGVLRELEIAGLDPDLVLDGSVSTVLVGLDGSSYRPEVAPNPAGRVLFAFPGRDGPHRGTYRMAFAYDAELGQRATATQEDGRVRFTWTLPGWQTGLDGVSVIVDAPPHAELASADVPEDGVEARTEASANGVRFTFRRPHLPRTLAWPVSFVLPRADVPAALRGEVRRTGRVALRSSAEGAEDERTGRILAALLALAAILKRMAWNRAVRLREASSEPLVPLIPNGLVHAVFVAAAAGLAVHFWARMPEVAFAALASVVLVGIPRSARRTRASRLGGFRPATQDDLRRARRASWSGHLEPLAFFDLREPAGWAVLGALAYGLLRMELLAGPAPRDAAFTTWHGLVLLVCLFASGSRANLPSTALERLDGLRRTAEKLRLPSTAEAPMAIALAVHCDAHGDLQDARIRLVTPHRLPGLVRLDVVLVDRLSLGGYTRVPSWLAVVRSGTEADRALQATATAMRTQKAPGGRRARLLDFDRRAHDVLGRLTAPPTSSAPSTRPVESDADVPSTSLELPVSGLVQ
ncbi:MAG: hypothetical protein U0230_07920 [Polyangiales bacterium]